MVVVKKLVYYAIRIVVNLLPPGYYERRSIIRQLIYLLLNTIKTELQFPRINKCHQSNRTFLSRRDEVYVKHIFFLALNRYYVVGLKPSQQNVGLVRILTLVLCSDEFCAPKTLPSWWRLPCVSCFWLAWSQLSYQRLLQSRPSAQDMKGLDWFVPPSCTWPVPLRWWSRLWDLKESRCWLLHPLCVGIIFSSSYSFVKACSEIKILLQDCTDWLNVVQPSVSSSIILVLLCRTLDLYK